MNRPKISDLIVHDPDDSQQMSRAALDLIDDLLLTVPCWDGLEDARARYMALVRRYEALHGCIECGAKSGHKFDCSHAR